MKRLWIALAIVMVFGLSVLGWIGSWIWLRVPGDSLFAIGAIAFVVFIFGLRFGYSVKSAAPGRVTPQPVGARTRS